MSELEKTGFDSSSFSGAKRQGRLEKEQKLDPYAGGEQVSLGYFLSYLRIISPVTDEETITRKY